MAITRPCKSCNNGWMSDLETAAKPIIQPLMHGKPGTITSVEQMVIARWLVKTSMNYELLRGRSPRYFKPQDYKALIQHGAVPEELLVFLGRYVGRHTLTASDHAAPILFGANTPHATTQDGYTVTLTIGQLAMQLFSFRRPKDYDGHIDVTVPGTWRRSTIEIWPSTLGDRTWPPGEAFDDTAINLFADRWFTPLRS
jgi:hypothetical protein